MSLRAYIATAALQGMLGNPEMTNHAAFDRARSVAESVLYADALIAELNKEGKTL